MQQSPYEQWQQPPYYAVNPLYMPVQPQPPAAKPKNTTMKMLSIICFSALALLVVLALVVAGAHAPTVVLGLLGCTWVIMFLAGFIFLCLI